MILVYFLSGGCVDDVVNNQTNHQFTCECVGLSEKLFPMCALLML